MGRIVQLRDISEMVPPELLGSPEVAHIGKIERTVKVLVEEGRLASAAEVLEVGMELRRQILDPGHPEALLAAEQYVICCNEWGVQFLTRGSDSDICVALELFKRAEVVTEEERFNSVRQRVALRAETLGNIACYYRLRGKLNAALQFASKVVKLEQHYKVDSPARSHLNLAVLLGMLEQHQEAIEHIELALASLFVEEREVEPGTPWCQELAAMHVAALHNLWVELVSTGKAQNAVESLLQATLLARERLGSEHPLTLKVYELLNEETGCDICPSCGNKFASDAVFCRKCGAKREEATSVALQRPRPGQRLPALVPCTRKDVNPMDLMPDEKITRRFVRDQYQPSPRMGQEEPRVRKDKKAVLLQRRGQLYGRVALPPKPLPGSWFAEHRKVSDESGFGFVGSPSLRKRVHEQLNVQDVPHEQPPVEDVPHEQPPVEDVSHEQPPVEEVPSKAEEEAAALKIQSIHRGKSARSRVDEMRQGSVPPTPAATVIPMTPFGQTATSGFGEAANSGGDFLPLDPEPNTGAGEDPAEQDVGAGPGHSAESELSPESDSIEPKDTQPSA